VLGRQTSGSVVCPSCGKLVGVNDAACWNCGRRNPGMWGYSKLLRHLGADFGVSQVVIWGCGALYIISLLLDPSAAMHGGSPFSFLSPSSASLRLLGAAGAIPVVIEHHWWTPLSAGWLHGGLLHILFNMLWVRQLAPATSAIYGPSRTMLLFIGASVVGFTLSSFGIFVPVLSSLLGGAGLTIGASAAIFGLLGALVYAGRRGIAVHLGRQAWIYAIILFVFGVLMPQVDNWAHLGGFLGGYGIAAWMNPLAAERTDHLFAAFGALLLTAAAILASVVYGLGGR
jgi:membrane associated rhomboid family serine protease